MTRNPFDIRIIDTIGRELIVWGEPA
jgi:hypothetical protein